MTHASHNVTFPNGQSVAPIGMGSWRLGQDRRPAKEEESALQLGIDLGMQVIDTAEMYGGGRSEILIGRAIKGRREDVFLVSKVYPWNATKQKMTAACDSSLERLNTESIDLYLLHWQTGTPLAEVVVAFDGLQRQGKIRAWGVSNFDADAMKKLQGVRDGAACLTDQVLYNAGSRGIELDLLKWCTRQAMPVMAYAPLGSGGDLLHHPMLAEISRKYGVTPATIALAWSIRNRNIIAIPESGNAVHIRENAAALTLQLDEEDVAAIDVAFPPPSHKTALDIL
ncbi:diketogulonate reductase-like aldo/keto reductase [Robbsia andropogonis]|uniref:aldo/keto reductase n=1 Tax=Robbsia andropogonis TaxID=28092 RepID=UPI003D1E8285